MNAKQLKAVRWHKKCMIDAMKAEDVEVRDIDTVLDHVIEEIDNKRDTRDKDEIRKEGYDAGYTDGKFSGYNDGWDEAAVYFGGDKNGN